MGVLRTPRPIETYTLLQGLRLRAVRVGRLSLKRQRLNGEATPQTTCHRARPSVCLTRQCTVKTEVFWVIPYFEPSLLRIVCLPARMVGASDPRHGSFRIPPRVMSRHHQHRNAQRSTSMYSAAPARHPVSFTISSTATRDHWS